MIWLQSYQARLGMTACRASPQVPPGANLMQPCSPHPVPHEFLTIQLPESSQPTKSTAWSRADWAALQLLKTPDLQRLQLAASTQIETGLALTADLRALASPAASMVHGLLGLRILVPLVTWQAPSTPLYGYELSLTIPALLTQLSAHSGQAPLHPWHWNPFLPQQSTNCCSEQLGSDPFLTLQTLSRTPVVENDQHDPHWPWFLMGVTAPEVLQSTPLATGSQVLARKTDGLRGCGSLLRVSILAANSSWVMSANWVMPSLQVWVLSALCLLIFAKFCSKMVNLQVSSDLEQLRSNTSLNLANSISASDLPALGRQKQVEAARAAINRRVSSSFIQSLQAVPFVGVLQQDQIGIMIIIGKSTCGIQGKAEDSCGGIR